MPLRFRMLFAALGLAAAARAAPLTPARVTELRTQIRANFFVDPLPALAPQVHRRFSPAPGVVAEAVSYHTQFGMRVPAILYLPEKAAGKVPAFIVVNGHGGDKYSWYAFYTGIAYARAGMAVLTYDPAGEGERSGTRASGTREHDRLQGDVTMARRLGGLMITDVVQAVSFLSQRPEIDPQRIGAGGYSMGSFVLALAGAVEPRLRACVLVGGGNLDGPEGYWDRSKQMCQGGPYRSLAFLGDRPAVLYGLHAARGPLLIWNGRGDSVVNMPNTQDAFFEDLRGRVVAQHGRTDGVFEHGFVDGASHRPYFVTKPVALWLERQLDLPAWDAAALQALPETRIGDWAARYGVEMDKLYATEEREAGARGIGEGVPGFVRESLSVFSAAEWEERKPKLVFEAWVAAARAATAK